VPKISAFAAQINGSALYSPNAIDFFGKAQKSLQLVSPPLIDLGALKLGERLFVCFLGWQKSLFCVGGPSLIGKHLPVKSGVVHWKYEKSNSMISSFKLEAQKI